MVNSRYQSDERDNWDVGDEAHSDVPYQKIEFYRFRDWKRIFVALALFLLFLFFGSVAAISAPRLVGMGILIGAVLFASWLYSQLCGYVFDFNNDTLSFPSFVIRRKVLIGELHDANAQIVYRTFMSAAASALGGNRHGPERQYGVNLSGDFGSRQLRFASRKRRDEFLSVLRHYVPHCRITRWQGW
jgi:hypothetical protein